MPKVRDEIGRLRYAYQVSTTISITQLQSRGTVVTKHLSFSALSIYNIIVPPLFVVTGIIR